MPNYRDVTIEELLKRTKIPLEVLDTDDDIYYDMVRVMMEEIRRNNSFSKNTVFIVPVGPVFQYRRFVRLANLEQLDCSHVYIFNMDEYLTDERQWIPETDPLSFRGFMKRELYSRLEGAAFIPEENRFFPEPGNEAFIWRKMQELGGVDMALGGIGIKGHIAFNEALDPEVEMSNEDFRQLPTRILPLTKETKTINSVTGLGGYIDGVPNWCITVGMKEILSARKIRFYMNREWQRGILRKICLDEVSGHAPATFFQEHPDAKLCVASYVTPPPCGVIR